MVEQKCLGFAELLKQVKTLTEWHKELQKKGEVDCRFCSIVGSKNACSDCTQVLAMQPKWVSVDVLKQWQEQLFKKFPMPFDDKYFESGYTGTPVFMSHEWADDFDEWKKDVFGEAFTRKGSLQEKKEYQT